MIVRSKKNKDNIQELTIDQWNAMSVEMRKRFEIIENKDQKTTQYPMQFPQQIKTIKAPVKKKIKK